MVRRSQLDYHGARRQTIHGCHPLVAHLGVYSSLQSHNIRVLAALLISWRWRLNSVTELATQPPISPISQYSAILQPKRWQFTAPAALVMVTALLRFILFLSEKGYNRPPSQESCNAKNLRRRSPPAVTAESRPCRHHLF